MTVTAPHRPSLYIAALLTLALAIASSSCSSDTAAVMSCERLKIVALNSFAITHGDYELNSGANSSNNACTDGTLPIELGPRSAMAEAPRWSGEIRRGESGEVLMPQTLPWRLTSILSVASGAAPLGNGLDDQEILLKAIPPSMPVQVFILLAKPLKESEVRALWPRPRSVMVAPDQPLIWESPIFCDYRGFNACQFSAHPEPLTAQFKKWVSLLQENDAQVLDQFNLKLKTLQTYAREGLIYGFTARDLPHPIRAIARDPRIRAVYVVDTDLPRN
ncbi:hypothetical protein HII36_11735 [Nonomuraea sp. NN258]|uniref:hypothetical protein n=1 Tax=Nonomuraea antri TaxID=2730852 RepID=UPI001C2C4EE6|nr:hypothetical protein [Nonomuraea antri]NRQ32504.1 hypothetical protein [Nonomuraea antri]